MIPALAVCWGGPAVISKARNRNSELSDLDYYFLPSFGGEFLHENTQLLERLKDFM